MLVPLSWLSDYVDPGLSVEALADLLTIGGLNVEQIRYPTAGTRGVKVAEVVEVDRVPGADRLWLVQAFDGEQTWQIVCGASNYQVGDRVPAALPGAALPGGFEISRRKLRGVTSNGMLCSPRELGVGADHAGIWILDRDAPLGADLAEWLDLDDPVFELEITPDRGYALSMIGVARDVAALTGAELRLPEPSPNPAGGEVVPVEILDPERCRRFDARVLRGVTIGPSPACAQRRLAAAGMRPVSNVVDITNYVMLATGNPTHAYDLARLAGPRIEVRTARPGETLVTLDGEHRALDPDDLLICDASGPIALAGVMGGEPTEVRASTTDVLMEVANFTPRTVLRTARRHRMSTEGSYRWVRAVPPETVPLAAGLCADLIAELAGGRVTGGADHYPSPPRRESIRLRTIRARGHLGVDLDAHGQAEALEAIGCEVSAAGDDTLSVMPPAYRPDLRQEVDLYEEIVRIYGYDKIPSRVPSSGSVGGRSPADDAVRAVRRALAGAGWTEALTLPFLAPADLERLGLAPEDPRRSPVALVNPLSKEESVLRTTLLVGLFRIAARNAHRQAADLALFETGRVFLPPTQDEPGADGGPTGVVLPAEPHLLGLVACGEFVLPRFDGPGRAVDFFDLLGAVEVARRAVGRDRLETVPTAELPYHPGRAARVLVDGEDIGVIGELHPRVIGAYELPARTVAGELRLDRLCAGGVSPARAAYPSPLPGLRFDVAVLVDESVPAAAVQAAVVEGAGPRLTACRLFDVFRGPQLGQGRKSLAYSLQLDDPGRQLTDTDEHAAIESVATTVATRVAGTLRR
ncbi:MAG: phenylalanine--tRNA ligase subunit beta [Egibacteraceae bacterium]